MTAEAPSLTLPETLLLFGLHDELGTVHPVAELSLEHGLRGAVLCELKLRGHLQLRLDGQVRLAPNGPEPPQLPFLAAALEVLASAESPGSVLAWFDALAAGLPELRAELIQVLERRGLLASPVRRTRPAARQRTWPLVDPSVEGTLREQVTAGLALGDGVPPRLGIALGLSVACGLAREVFGDREVEAIERAAWVAERDSIVRLVVAEIAAASGR